MCSNHDQLLQSKDCGKSETPGSQKKTVHRNQLSSGSGAMQ